MKMEVDHIEWPAGVRAGDTLGPPIAMLGGNRDWESWRDVRAPEAEPAGERRRRQVTRPRPGHAALTGVLKYDRQDARDILERASARETVARVACGAVCKLLLEQFHIEIGSHVVELGGVTVRVGAQHAAPLPSPLNAAADASPIRCLDPQAERDMIARIDAAKAAGDTVGGVVEVVALGVPVGLGSHLSWDRKLDGRIAQAVMSIPAVKGVEVRRGLLGRAGAQLRRVPGAGCCARRFSLSASRRGGQGVRTMKRHVVLIGLPGCGKTTVGRLAAETLHAGFVDIDAILARRAGKPIALIFAEQGEPAFRVMERKEMEATLGNQAAIVAPGGGWAAQPGAIER